MAITLEANYSKKLGLPGFSSHQYSVTIKAELSDIKQVETETARLYTLLQSCVDRDLQQTGFLPANGHNGNGNKNGEAWACSDKQKALILKVIDDQHLDKHHIESLAQERFNKGVRHLNKMEASGFIEELLSQPGNGNGSRVNRYQTKRAL